MIRRPVLRMVNRVAMDGRPVQRRNGPAELASILLGNSNPQAQPRLGDVQRSVDVRRQG